MKLIIEGGWPEDRDQSKQNDICGHCGAHLKKGEKFCRFCGTRRGVGRYVPNPYREVQCIYGPPPARRTRKCTACGYEWDTFAMIDNEKYCPRCGASAKIIYDEFPMP